MLELNRTLLPVPGVFGAFKIPFEPFRWRLRECCATSAPAAAACSDGDSTALGESEDTVDDDGGGVVTSPGIGSAGGGGGGGSMGAVKRGEGHNPSGENWTRSIGPFVLAVVEDRILEDGAFSPEEVLLDKDEAEGVGGGAAAVVSRVVEERRTPVSPSRRRTGV